MARPRLNSVSAISSSTARLRPRAERAGVRARTLPRLLRAASSALRMRLGKPWTRLNQRAVHEDP